MNLENDGVFITESELHMRYYFPLLMISVIRLRINFSQSLAKKGRRLIG